MKILIIQLRRIGDILLTTPVLSYLQKSIPGVQLDFLAESAGKAVLETNPRINNLFIYDSRNSLKEILKVRAQKYDAVLDFMDNPRTSYLTFFSGARWRVGPKRGIRSLFYNPAISLPDESEYVPLRKLRITQSWLEKAGISRPPVDQVRPELYLTEADTAFAQDWVGKEGLDGQKFVVLSPVSRYEIRRWRSEGYRALGLELSQAGYKVYLAWGPGEEKDINEIRSGIEDKFKLLPATTVRQMAAIFKQARLVVNNDQGTVHLAVAVGTPTATVYGPTRPKDWNPSLSGVGPRDRVLRAAGVDCLGCHLKECPVGHLCMKNLKEETVINTCLDLLKETSS